MMQAQQKRNRRTTGGFTLVELMVSVAIFAIVMTISSGTLLVLIDLNAKAQALYSATSNISFALDSMSREIRTGYYYYCSNVVPGDGSALPPGNPDGGNECPTGGGRIIVFTRERDTVRVGYKLDSGRIERKEASGDWIPITAEEVTISRFDITMVDSETYHNNDQDTDQPKIDLLISGYMNNGLDTDTDFTIQTRMIGRRLDVI